MENKKNDVFRAFAAKAAKRLEEKKTAKSLTLHVPSMDEDIKIRSLTYGEIVECTEMEDEGDPNRADKYAIYLAVTEPDLKKTAQELKDQGIIREYTEIVDIFEMHEIREIATEVMKLSGYLGDRKVTVVNELKNS